MLYKGGPKNYSKGDWMFIKLLVGLVIVWSIGAMIMEPDTVSSKTSAGTGGASSEYVAAANRSGYRGDEAEQVAAAAERLCNSTGEC